MTKIINKNKLAGKLRLKLDDANLDKTEREELEIKYDSIKNKRFNKLLLPKLTQVLT